MELTGKCEEDFEKYLKYAYIIDGKIESLDLFYFLPQSMKYGIYVDFFDSVGITIVIDAGGIRYEDSKEIWYQSGVKGHRFNEATNLRQEARTKAIEKANEIYNEKI